jgi:hypothetical protein
VRGPIRRWLFLVAIAAGLVAAFALPQHAKADASGDLQAALSTLRGLGSQSFNRVALWARNGTPTVFAPVRDYERVEAQILNLGGDDRQAVLWWLQGNGRSTLYARGATDFQIGPPRQGVDQGTGPLPTPTPNAWRELRLASNSLGGTTAGEITVLGGFAAAKRDGTGATACISFKNAAPKAATRIIFEFPLVDASGNELGTLTLDREGTFSPDVAIMTYQTFSDWAGGTVTNRGYAQNCASLSSGIAAVPILTARYATYRLRRVEYADGSVWMPSNNP